MCKQSILIKYRHWPFRWLLAQYINQKFVFGILFKNIHSLSENTKFEDSSLVTAVAKVSKLYAFNHLRVILEGGDYLCNRCNVRIWKKWIGSRFIRIRVTSLVTIKDHPDSKKPIRLFFFL